MTVRSLLNATLSIAVRARLASTAQAILTVAICAAAGCALLGKNEPQQRRYFTPEALEGAPAGSASAGSSSGQKPPNTASESPTAGTQATAPGSNQKLRLRLGRVTAWTHLRERMVTRTAARELSFSETRRWTERPDIYLQRALSHAFFEERGLTQVLAGGAPTLEVELVAFEEVENPRRGLFQAQIVLHDGLTVQVQQTVTVEQAIESKESDATQAIVDALARALKLGVEQIAERVVRKL